VRAILLFVVIALACGCRLYFWAGEHELTLPPEPKESMEATPTPST
jgi:hypothetical protein